MKSRHLDSAFTLAELIVVITILAILATIAFISYESYTSKSRDSVRLADSSNIRKGLEVFLTKSGNLPVPGSATVFTGTTSFSLKQWVIDSSVAASLGMSPGVADPLSKSRYTYSIMGGKYYQVAIEKENISRNINPLIDDTYAATTTSSVLGNYFFDPSLPSLIVSTASVPSSGIFDPSVCFVTDGGTNLISSASGSCTPKKSLSLKTADSSLAGYWDMETLCSSGSCGAGNDGKLADLSGNGNVGIFSGGMSYATALTGGIVGNGLFFSSGAGNQIVVNNVNGLDIPWSITICSINRPINFVTGGSNYVFFQRQGNYTFWILSTSALRFADQNGNGYATNVFSIAQTNYQFCWEYDASSSYIRIYINGSLFWSTKLDSWAWTKTSLSTAQSFIGANVSGVNGFNGNMDELKVYTRPLSDAEIAQQAKIAGF